MKALKTIQWAFAIAGIVILAGASFLHHLNAEFLEDAHAAKGVVIDLVRQDTKTGADLLYPVVRYEDEQGRTVEFRSSYGTYPASYHRGEEVQVLFVPGEPESAQIDSSFSLWAPVIFTAALGMLFFLIAVGLTIVPALRSGGVRKLRQSGRLVQGQFQCVERNTGFEVNGKNPYRIVCQWQNPATSDIHVFRSDNLWFDPTDHIQRESIPVYINPSNPKRYWVDTSFLPKMAS